MSPIIQTLLTTIGATGICTLIFNSIVQRSMNKTYAKIDNREELRKENDLLMMARMDAIADMTHLMAKKLHDAGIINGDLEELNRKYKELDAKYDGNIKRLALEVLNK